MPNVHISAPYLLLGFVVLPMWVAAGFTDYFCHRAARIHMNSGTPESFLHLVQFSLIGLPVMLALFLRPNAGFLLFALFCILLHHVVAYVDVRYADTTRKIAPTEQMVHSFLELLPIAAFLLLAVAEWSQFLALWGLGSEARRFAPEPRSLPAAYTAAILAAAFLFNFVPYLEELMRCLGASNKR